MTTVPYTATQADVEFFSHIMLDHSAMLHLGLESDPYKDQAFQLWQQWRTFIQNGHPYDQLMSLVQDLKLFKQTVLEQLEAGQWLGWLSTAFVKHILEELMTFEMMLNGQRLAPSLEAVQAMRLLSEHVEDAESKFDPTELEFKDQAMQLINNSPEAIRSLDKRDLNNLLGEYEQTVQQLAREQSQPQTDLQFLIGLSLRSGEQINQFFGRVKTEHPKSIIHSDLLDHWMREYNYFTQELQLSREQLQSRAESSSSLRAT